MNKQGHSIQVLGPVIGKKGTVHNSVKKSGSTGRVQLNFSGINYCNKIMKIGGNMNKYIDYRMQCDPFALLA